MRGGRAGLDTWEPAAGERIVPAGVLREQAPTLPAPRVALAADACAQELLRVIRARQDTRRRIRSGHLDPGALAGVLAGRRTVYQQPSRAPRRTVALLVVADLSDSTADQRPELRDALHLARLACDGRRCRDRRPRLLGHRCRRAPGAAAVGRRRRRAGRRAGARRWVVERRRRPPPSTLAGACSAPGRRPTACCWCSPTASRTAARRCCASAVDDARHDGVVVFGCYFGDDRRTRDALAACFDDDFAVLRDLRDAAPRVFARIADLLA